MKSKRLFLIFFSCLILTLINSIRYFTRIKFYNSAWYGGDTWEYQSRAVNFAYGHGLKFGAVEDFSIYKFGSGYECEVKLGSDSDKWFREAGNRGGTQTYFGTPGYSAFVGLIYKLGGINPVIVKNIQLFMLIVLASFLPMLAFLYWGWRGYVSGLIAGNIFIHQYTRPLSQQLLVPALTYPDQILSETLITLAVFAVVVMMTFWEKKTNLWSSLFLGLVLGVAVLVKASLSLIPWFVVIFAWFWLKKQDLSRKNAFLILIGVLLVVGPWSWYVSHKLGKPVFISTQSDLLLLQTNNEESMDGSWHPGALQRDDSYYKKENIVNLPTSLKVVRFYLDHPKTMPITFFNKVNNAFSYFVFLKYVFVFVSFQLMIRILNFLIKPRESVVKRVLVNLLYVVLTVAVIGIYYYYYHQIYTRRNDPPFSLVFSPAFFLSITTILYGVHLALTKKVVALGLPNAFIIIFLNYLLITLCTLGMIRIVQVIDFIFILIGTRYLIDWLESWLKVFVGDRFICKSIRENIFGG